MNEREKIDRAERVAKIIGSDEFNAAFNGVKQAIYQKIEECPIRDTEGLMHLRICLKLLGDVRANLVQALNDGKAAEFNIEQRKKTSFGFFRGSK